ncbi:hypothetical protein [Verminephrobacter eiseniae]|uniref:hypothetical protein n=1 Tax=Verminephrobacter eiseniae TaxID=364317 RepID=UPI00223781E8|nr:hypothetical protein [Verminephrobacter eiseniae]MCW5231823.1 hypothetical protein [Verminephrobacter eiseniae]MCW5260105.1 hypothetical protein [Verminephrobacter eiseniae]MCW5293557.1 hypothetical protein [Verminephrobacter eiseniae]MCW8186206.1 hypothetical protein [Verminephrobacter eiseniae]MCW8223055.1 hypothetical protein [Verminephrobacter eiseniae]
MLIYANSLVLKPIGGPDKIIQLVAKWVGQRTCSYVDGTRLAQGIREFKLKDGSTLSSRTTAVDDNQTTYPYLFCARFSHGDAEVPGRRRTTEVGLRQEAADQAVECSLLLKTDEISVLVTAPVRPTRPDLVEQLIKECNPVEQTPGLMVKRLTEESAPAFLCEVERIERDFPIVLISSTAYDTYPVDPERLRSILVGLADVVEVPAMADTFAIENIVGRRYMAFGGAVNTVFPRWGDQRSLCKSSLILPGKTADILVPEILATVTHRTNLPNSWRHISQEMVSQARLRAQLARMIEQAGGGEQSVELTEYMKLLETAGEESRAKDDEIKGIRAEHDQKEREFQATIESLKHVRRGYRANDEVRDDMAPAPEPLRELVAAVLKGSPGLQQVQELISTLYADRLVFLKTAASSAKESDRGGFSKGATACELLLKLATDYWSALADGKTEQQAKAVFGQSNYAANEAQALTNDGKQRRTFMYQGRKLVMEKHLKHGVKDSLAETLRVYFEWVADERKIVIGHCGKHLPF